MTRREWPARVGAAPGRIKWVGWGGQRVAVREILRWWDEPAAPWTGHGERHYARLLMVTGAVLEIYHEDDRWVVCGVED